MNPRLLKGSFVVRIPARSEPLKQAKKAKEAYDGVDDRVHKVTNQTESIVHSRTCQASKMSWDEGILENSKV